MAVVVALITICKLLRLDEYWVVVGYCHLELISNFTSKYSNCCVWMNIWWLLVIAALG
jgi:hypothetical protein